LHAANLLDPFALWTAFPPSAAGRDSGDYYESYARSRRHQPTTRLPARQHHADRWGGHQDRSHVHCGPFVGL